MHLSGARWDVKGEWEEAVAKIRPLALAHDIQCWDGEWFWESLLPWRGRMGQEKSLCHWWHGEPSDRYNLVQRWEDLTFRIGELFNYTCLDLRERDKHWYALCQSPEELLSPAYFRSVAKETEDDDTKKLYAWFAGLMEKTVIERDMPTDPNEPLYLHGGEATGSTPGVRPMANPTLAEMLPAVPLGVRPAAARTSV